MAIAIYNYGAYRKNKKKIIPKPAPLAPVYLTAAWLNTYVVLEWSHVNKNRVQYEILRSYDGSTYEKIYTTAANADFYAYEPELGANMYFKVRAKDGNNYSKYTNVIYLSVAVDDYDELTDGVTTMRKGMRSGSFSIWYTDTDDVVYIIQ